MTEFFADTYALIAHLEDRPSYRSYFDGTDLVTTRVNLLEVAYILHHRHQVPGEDLTANLAPLRPLVRTPAPSVISQAAAAKKRFRSSGKRVSYIDAWGYATARWLEVPFLTGDDDFEDIDHVEFVKA